MRKLIVYGSFGCPYCFLASSLMDQVPPEAGVVIKWRAVVHRAVPKQGLSVEGDRAIALGREVADVARLGGPGFEIHLPQHYPDTTIATATLASTSAANAGRVRRALFWAYWVDGADIGDPDVVLSLAGHVSTFSTRAEVWRQAWLGLSRQVVPVLIDVTGVPRSAIRRLQQMVSSAGVPQAI